MKNLFHRLLPIAAGVALGLLMSFPPDVLGLPPAVRNVAAFLLTLVLLLAFCVWVVARSLPESPRWTPVAEDRLTATMEPLVARYEKAGFARFGPPLELDIKPRALVVPLTHERVPAYGTIFRTTTVPARTQHDIVSLLMPGGTLTTVPSAEAAVLTTTPGSYVQALPGADVDTLLAHHEAALAHLARRGCHARRAAPEAFQREYNAAIARARQHFFTRPVRHALQVLWRVSRKTTPYLGPLEDQELGRLAAALGPDAVSPR